MNGRWLLWLLGVLALFTTGPAAASDELVPPQVIGQLDRLRHDWPEVAQAEMRNGRRFEFRDGVIHIGEVTFNELASAPENASGVVLAFLIGHEAWHSVQAARRTSTEFRRMRDSGLLECEADFMGAASAWRHMSATQDEHGLEKAHADLIGWLTTQSALAGSSRTYPTAEERGWTAAIGWGQAADPELIRYLGREPALDEAGRAGETCQRIVRVSDGSLGVIEINWTLQPDADDRDPSQRATVAYRLTAENRSTRSIVANVLVPTWQSYSFFHRREAGGGMIRGNRAIEVLDFTMNLSPNQKMEYVFEFPVAQFFDREDSSWDDSRILFPTANGQYSTLISAQYTASSPPEYCTDRVLSPDAQSNISLIARLATIALSADDDFEAIRSERRYDINNDAYFQMSPALAFSDADTITISSFGISLVNVHVAKTNEDEAAIALFEQFRALLRQVCGSENVVELPVAADADPDERAIEILRFAPKAELRMDLSLARRYTRGIADAPSTGGIISVTIRRDAVR